MPRWCTTACRIHIFSCCLTHVASSAYPSCLKSTWPIAHGRKSSLELSIHMYAFMVSWWIFQRVPESSIETESEVKPCQTNVIFNCNSGRGVEGILHGFTWTSKGSAGALLLHGNRPPQRWNPCKFLKLTKYLVIASPLFDAKLLPPVDCTRDLVVWRQNMLRELHDSWWTEVGSEESDPAGQQPSIAQTEACTQPHTCMDNISGRGKHMMNIGKSTKPCRLGFAELLEVKASSPWLLELDPNSCNCTYAAYATNSTHRHTHTHTPQNRPTWPNMA